MDQKILEKAISFLVEKVNTSGHNPKPVIFHSIKVGIYLYNKGYKEDIIIAGFLHDLLEDSNTKVEELTNLFGKNVAKLVQAITFNDRISSKEDSYKDELNRVLSKGKDGLIVKAADFIDNAQFYDPKSKEIYDWCIYKIKTFIQKSESAIGSEQLWEDLVTEFKKASKKSQA